MVRAFELANGETVPYKVAPRRAGDMASCYAHPTGAHAMLVWSTTYALEAKSVNAWNWQKNAISART